MNTKSIDKNLVYINGKGCNLSYDQTEVHFNGRWYEIQEDQEGQSYIQTTKDCVKYETHYISQTPPAKSIDKEVLEITPGEWEASISTPTEQSEKWGGNCGANASIYAYTDKLIFGRPTTKTIAFLPHWRDEKDTAEHTANAKAICKAINGTYGKGYNPDAMDELYRGIKTFLQRLNDFPIEGMKTEEIALLAAIDVIAEDIFETALNNAKL